LTLGGVVHLAARNNLMFSSRILNVEQLVKQFSSPSVTGFSEGTPIIQTNKKIKIGNRRNKISLSIRGDAII